MPDLADLLASFGQWRPGAPQPAQPPSFANPELDMGTQSALAASLLGGMAGGQEQFDPQAAYEQARQQFEQQYPQAPAPIAPSRGERIGAGIGDVLTAIGQGYQALHPTSAVRPVQPQFYSKQLQAGYEARKQAAQEQEARRQLIGAQMIPGVVGRAEEAAGRRMTTRERAAETLFEAQSKVQAAREKAEGKKEDYPKHLARIFLGAASPVEARQTAEKWLLQHGVDDPDDVAGHIMAGLGEANIQRNVMGMREAQRLLTGARAETTQENLRTLRELGVTEDTYRRIQEQAAQDASRMIQERADLLYSPDPAARDTAWRTEFDRSVQAQLQPFLERRRSAGAGLSGAGIEPSPDVPRMGGIAGAAPDAFDPVVANDVATLARVSESLRDPASPGYKQAVKTLTQLARQYAIDLPENVTIQQAIDALTQSMQSVGALGQ